MLGKFHLRHDPVVFAVQILFGLILLRAGGKNDHAMLDFSLIHTRSHQNFRGEVTLESGKPHDKGLGQYLDHFMGHHTIRELRQIGLNLGTFNGGRQLVGHTAKTVFLFHQKNLVSLVCKP